MAPMIKNTSPPACTCQRASFRRKFAAHGLLLVGFFLVLLLAGCLPTDRKSAGPLAELGHDEVNSARVSCFLTLKDREGPAIRLEIAGIELLADSFELPLTRGPLTVESTAIGAGQIFLGGRAVPPGHYQRVRLTVTKRELQKADGQYAVVAGEPFQLEMGIDLTLEPEDSRSLFMTWDVQDSLQPGPTLQPVLTVNLPLRQLLRDLVFVSCPEIDTVFVVRADKNWVVDSFGLKGQPTYLAIDSDSSRQRLYGLATGDRMVKVVDLSSYRIMDFFPVPLNDDPTFMTISPDGQGAFLLDERSGYLSRLDLNTGRIMARVLLGYRPKYLAYLNQQNLLAVSLSLSQRVLLLNPSNLSEVGTILTGSSPEGLAAMDNQLYVADFGDNTVDVADLIGRGSQSRLTVGFGPRRLIATDNQIFVSNYLGGSLSVLVPGQLGVIQEIVGLGQPLEMAFDRFYRRLYVADEGTASLAVIDVNTNRLLGRIMLGAKPFGMAVIQ
jgi:YVTN family beta-propeller protein